MYMTVSWRGMRECNIRGKREGKRKKKEKENEKEKEASQLWFLSFLSFFFWATEIACWGGGAVDQQQGGEEDKRPSQCSAAVV